METVERRGAGQAPTTSEPEAKALEDSGVFVPFSASVSWSEVAMVGLAILALFWTFCLASAFLIPVAAAFYLKLVLTRPVRRLRAWGVPSPVGAVLVVGTSVLLAVGTAYQLSGPANDWIERAPDVLRRAEVRLREIKKPVEKVSLAAEQVEEIADVDGSGNRAEVEVRGPNLASYFFRSTGNLMATAVSTTVLLYLLLAAGDLFLRKTITIMPRLEDKVRAVDFSKQLESHITTYLLTVCVVNVCLGMTAALALYVLGMPNPALWGAMVACSTLFLTSARWRASPF